MNNRVLHYGSLLILATILFSCELNTSTVKDDESTIIALAKKRSKAVVESDSATLNDILDQRFRYINISGQSLSREDYLSNNSSLGNDSASYWVSQNIDSIQVSMLDRTAVITFRVLDKFVYEAIPYENYCRSTFVYEKQGAVWKCVLGHTTKIE
jgi:hypothetical protein